MVTVDDIDIDFLFDLLFHYLYFCLCVWLHVPANMRSSKGGKWNNGHEQQYVFKCGYDESTSRIGCDDGSFYDATATGYVR